MGGAADPSDDVEDRRLAPTGPDAGATFYPAPAPPENGRPAWRRLGSNYQAAPMCGSISAAWRSAIWGCELAAGDGRERIYIVAPTGDWFDDPNLTDKKFPGNPTRSYRSRFPLRIIGEVESWEPHAPEILQAMKDNLARLQAEGAPIID